MSSKQRQEKTDGQTGTLIIQDKNLVNKEKHNSTAPQTTASNMITFTNAEFSVLHLVYTLHLLESFMNFLVFEENQLDLPSGGLLFWLFQTTSSLAKLGTLEISVMTRKRLSTRSQVSTTAVNPGALGGISGRNRGLFTLDHFCTRKEAKKAEAVQPENIFFHSSLYISMKSYCRASLMSSVSSPVCIFHDLIHCNSAPMDSEVTCSNFQMMVFIMEHK